MAFILSLFYFSMVWVYVVGHGMVLDPVNRGSIWRFSENGNGNDDCPPDYDDSASFCGGFQIQHEENKGKCGICGDDYSDARPRAHELGGVYGKCGVVSGPYASGAKIATWVRIVANHNGYFEYSLCDYSAYGKEEEECFVALAVSGGGERYYVPSKLPGNYPVDVKLPDGLTCEHCILRWQYTAGNNWGVCENGTQSIGCGPQETYRTCSDISIL